MSDVMTISKRNAAGLEEVLRTLLLDSDNKVPAKRLRIVGAITDGAVMESGSNSNGYWIKYADGTAVCYQPRTSFVVNSETGATAFSGVWKYYVDITFPLAFTQTPSMISDIGVNHYDHGWSQTHQVNLIAAQIIIFTPRSALSPVNTVGGCWFAVGRWKA